MLVSPKRAKRVLWTGVFALAAVLLALVSIGGSAPTVCSACHGAPADALSRTGHVDLDCYACHAPSPGARVAFKASELVRMYPAKLVGGAPEGTPSIRISDSGCRDCHAEVLDPGSIVTARGLRIEHAACVGDASCASCHSVDAHGSATRYPRSPSMGRCVDCHSDVNASVECATCHTEGYERDDLLRGPFRVTHGANWKQTHGMGDLRQCLLCHQPSDCAGCHGAGVPHAPGFGTSHGESALSSDADCSSCHQPRFCTDCHGIEMPHGPQFLPQHSTVANGMTDATCLRCHTTEDCLRCHLRHVHPGGAGEPR